MEKQSRYIAYFSIEFGKKNIYFFFSNFRGGLFGGYCGPPSFKGVCCVFVSGNCGKRFTEKISYFTNKSFPKSDIEPYQCLLSIKPLQNTCWVCVFNKFYHKIIFHSKNFSEFF